MALYTIRGMAARLLKLILGIPLLYVGWLGISAGLGNPVIMERILFLSIGGLLGAGGIGAFVSAIMNEELVIGAEDEQMGWE